MGHTCKWSSSMPLNTSLSIWENVFNTSSGSAANAVSTFACSPGRWTHWICVQYHHPQTSLRMSACVQVPAPPTRTKWSALDQSGGLTAPRGNPETSQAGERENGTSVQSTQPSP